MYSIEGNLEEQSCGKGSNQAPHNRMFPEKPAPVQSATNLSIISTTKTFIFMFQK
jgi:hypothetical protein